MGKAIAFTSSVAGGSPGPPGPAGPPATPPNDVTIGAFTLVQVHTSDGGFGQVFQLAVTPPGPLGTFIGCHLYLEFPDQSAGSTFVIGTSTIGTGSLQGTWAPLDLGKFPYSSTQQPFTIPVPSGIDLSTSIPARIYAASYSPDVDNLVVQAGLAGATPNAVLTVIAPVRPKPVSGSDVTPLIVTGVSALVSPAITVAGKLRRPIAIGVDLSGLGSSIQPQYWRYQLLGFKDNDLTQDPCLISGQYSLAYTLSDPAPAGPDGITVAHTFGPEEPNAIWNITVYAVAGLMEVAGPFAKTARAGDHSSFVANNIIPGITASVNITIGTTAGVVDPLQFITTNISPVFGNVANLFDIVPLAIDNTRQGTLAVSSLNLQGLAVTNPKLASLAVQAANLAASSVSTGAIQSFAVVNGQIANLAVGTAAIQSGAITNALIANLAVGTANIQNLAVTDAQIGSLSVSKLLAGTISVTGTTTPAVIVKDSGSAGKTSVFAGAVVSTYTSGVVGVSIGAGAGGDASLDLTNSSGVNEIQLSTFTPGMFIRSLQVVSTRVATTPVTLADVIAVLQHNGLSN